MQSAVGVDVVAERIDYVIGSLLVLRILVPVILVVLVSYSLIESPLLIWKVFIFDQIRYSVHSESANSQVQPKLQNVLQKNLIQSFEAVKLKLKYLHHVHQPLVSIVQVWLLLSKLMQVVLFAIFTVLPCRELEYAVL